MPVPTLLAHAVLVARLAVPAPAPYPFAVGETLTYDATLGYFPVGSATAQVTRLTRERGKEAFVFALTGQGGPPGVRVRYELTSWVGTGRFASLRFHRKLVQGRSVEEERYQIVADSGRYRQEGVAREWVTPPDALDELAFLYYLRTVPLEVGRRFTVPRYFKTGLNPIAVHVLERRTLTLPDGRRVPGIAVQVSAQGSTMAVRFTDDARRLPVELDLPLPYGSVTLTLAQTAAAPPEGAGGS